jgi:sterol desaturase/sphingolipid hydroxylase (fatty acid hydroxylase superfamily)
VRTFLAWFLFPATLVASIGGAAWLVEGGAISNGALLGLTSLGSVLVVALAERLLPYRSEWNRPQGDLATDAAYLPITLGVNGLLRPVVATFGVALGGWLSETVGLGLWPTEWPLLAQLALACVTGEFFDYWAHRVMHESACLWRLHATHHSAPRLYWLNATRAHPGEMLFRGAVEMLPLAVFGIGEGVLLLIAVVNIVVGLFQHANIDFRLGPMSWIFSVGELHRWHHSRSRDEANRNYGNNFIFWDAVFGTRFLPADREPPAKLGIEGLDGFPRTLGAQLLAPFRWSGILARSSSAA